MLMTLEVQCCLQPCPWWKCVDSPVIKWPLTLGGVCELESRLRQCPGLWGILSQASPACDLNMRLCQLPLHPHFLGELWDWACKTQPRPCGPVLVVSVIVDLG